MIRVVYYIAFFQLFLAAEASDDGIGSGLSPGFDEDFFDELLSATGGKVDYKQASLLEAMFGVNTEGADLGSRCGTRNPCLPGLQCVATGGVGWKICLPLACIQSVVNEYNEQGGEVTLFENYARNVMTGANLSPDSIDEAELVNETTLALGRDAMRGNNRQHILKDSVREALIKSLKDEQAKDSLNIGELERQVATCFQPKLPQVVGGGQSVGNTTADDPGARRLQQGDNTVATLPGFFLELSAVFQFVFALGIWDPDTNPGEIIINDYCFGAGPTIGAGTGFLLQIWWVPNFLGTDPGQQSNETNSIKNAVDSVMGDKQGRVFVPWPAAMIDLDAALGPGFGIAYNTIGFGCHRLWLKFYVGAGGGLAFSVCAVQLIPQA